jgi:hypothetical protein
MFTQKNLFDALKTYGVTVCLSIFFGVLLFVTRFYNYQHTLYFIYDQGRDVLKLSQIVRGDFTLIGPTSGLAGFFLGPLWYYIGVPGYIVSNGNPYGISLWYIVLATLTIPLYWLMVRKLLPFWWAVLATTLFIITPGSIKGSTFVWNPLISLPLMAGTMYALVRARTSNWYLGLGFFLLALTLQSEFAYGIFFIPPLVVLIPWIKQRFHIKDFLVAVCAGAVTLLPQLIFEIRNTFLLTKSLVAGVTAKEGTFSLIDVWKIRPYQLYEVTAQMLYGGTNHRGFFTFGAILLMVIASLVAFGSQKRTNQDTYAAKLLVVLTFIPYIGYLFWRGNYGQFFDYYLTSHIVFLVPLVVLGSYYLIELTKTKKALFTLALLSVIPLTAMGKAGWEYTRDIVIWPNNQAGLYKMEQAIDQLYSWQAQTADQSASFLVYTPSWQTEHYDYLIAWKAGHYNLGVPSSQRTHQEKEWFLMMEEEKTLYEKRFEPWYRNATAGGQLKERRTVGVLTLEWWQAQ